jgi:hypothetical protein
MESNTAQAVRSNGNALTEGVARMVSGACCMVATPAGLLRATRAAGCLLAPAAGDRVLLALTPDNAWVLAVLERGEGGAATLELPPRTTIDARETLILTAGDLRAEAASLTLSASFMRFSGKLLLQSFESVRTMAARLVELVFRRHARYGKVKEETVETREVSAGRMRVDCAHSVRLSAENLDIKARELLDMDAGHIKLG